jgi:hypothetical protein
MVAIVPRVAGLMHPYRYFYSDSWDYVIPALNPKGFVDGLHSPVVGWLWRRGTLGNLSQVPLAQLVVGALVSFGALWRWRDLPRYRKITGLGVGIALTPLTIFYELSYLSDAVAGQLLALSLLALCATPNKLKVDQPLRIRLATWICPSLAAFLAGAAGAARPALLPVSGVIALLAGFSLPRPALGIHHSILRGMCVGVTLVLWQTAFLPLRNANEREFGVRSIVPASGSATFAKWAPLLAADCTWPIDTGTQKSFVQELCAEPDRLRPYDQNLWTYLPMIESMNPHPEFENRQAFLGRTAVALVIRNPAEVLSSFSVNLRRLVTSPFSDLHAYESVQPDLRAIVADPPKLERRRGGAPGQLVQKAVFWSARVAILAATTAAMITVVVSLRRRRLSAAGCRYLLVFGSSVSTIALGGAPMARYLIAVGLAGMILTPDILSELD